MVKIQIVSDLHLEFRGNNFKKIITPSAPILCLLGDICACGDGETWNTYKNFIEYISPKYQYVFHIPGNHEYYTQEINPKNTFEGINKKLKEFARTIKNLSILNNNCIRITIRDKKYVFIGSTLWSDVPKKYKSLIKARMNDYSMIWKSTPDGVRRFTIDDMIGIHRRSVKYISNAINRTDSSDSVVLLTHHRPIRCLPETNIKSYGYETDLPNIIKPPLKIAAHGHTHEQMDRYINNVRIISNPKGYIHQKTKFNPTLVFEI